MAHRRTTSAEVIHATDLAREAGVSRQTLYTWQHLVVEGRWKPRETIDRIVATLRETLLARG